MADDTQIAAQIASIHQTQLEIIDRTINDLVSYIELLAERIKSMSERLGALDNETAALLPSRIADLTTRIETLEHDVRSREAHQ